MAYTYHELKGKTIAWIGDANNMCRTWRQAAISPMAIPRIIPANGSSLCPIP